jgi:diaminohydroxyphosphoribosylaminopyrimidine deaminase/5-amino-6-(5-phosphoribosylamino)uracil reductase
MRRALEIAIRGVGRVSPNPLVGCVIVKDDRIIGEGAHLEFGGPHAEPNAIADAESRGESIEGSTVYVTLEPHSHQGKTAPCSELLVRKRIARCIIAMQDPYSEVNGHGIAQLRDAGIDVSVGVLEAEARELNRFFIKHVTTGMPYVTLKIAQSLDGKSALANGQSQWITSEASRARVHEARAEYDAVLVGTSTANIDDPSLTVRHVAGRQPWRIVLDARGELRTDLRLLHDEFRHRTIVATTDSRAAQLAGQHPDVTVLPLGIGDRIDLERLFATLASRGIASIYVEAGPQLAASLVRQSLYDELAVFIAPVVLGSDARSSIGPLALGALRDAPRLTLYSAERIGDDVLLRLRK